MILQNLSSVCRIGSQSKRVKLLGTTIGFLLLNVSSAIALDPFRSSTEARMISEPAVAAFEAMFEQGNYQNAQWHLQQAQSEDIQEPMVYGMLATFAYQQEDWQALADYSEKILTVAEGLKQTDALRGNLYIAIGHFMEGAHTLATEGTFRGAPKALNKLEEVFTALDAAEAVNAEDPELNLIRGYLELFLSLNLPFNNPENAITKLETYGSPRHLAYRGIAVGYRDLKDFEKALNFVDQALETVPNNPEVLYLKAQILASLGQRQDPTLLTAAQDNFKAALAQPQQLPKRVVAQIFFEQCKNLNRIDQVQRPCDPLRDTIRERDGLWGPTAEQMPTL
ncbi:MAG: Sll0314/Alr1548 family TPR repeat-containing protein [Microcoleaceae cyanobacterium]